MNITNADIRTIKRAQNILCRAYECDSNIRQEVREVAIELGLMIHNMGQHTFSELDEAAAGLHVCSVCGSRVRSLSEGGLCSMCLSMGLKRQIKP
jgi:hypothetical protein